jgi:TrmH family RNA methyltransferase
VITSSQNSKFKELKKLVKTKNKSSDEFFLVEGAREIEKAIQNKFIMSTWIAGEKHSKMIPGHNIPTLDLAQNLYSQLVLRSDEPLALFYRKKWLFSDFEGVALKKVLILDHVEKPGNIGAMLRTSVAFDFDLTIITGVKVDLYNSNIIRNSLGHVFDKPVILSALDQALTFLTQKKVKLFGAVLDSSSLPIEEIALTSKCY